MDSKGRVWVPDNRMHGGPGWRRHNPNGTHDHVYDGGNGRQHFDSGMNQGVANIVTGVILLIVLVADDATGFGVADNVMIPVAFALIISGFSGENDYDEEMD